jgi:hypothetical protein
MEPIIDLIWSVEEEATPDDDNEIMSANCGGCGGCCVACCCSIPSIITKWLCN